MDPLTTISTRRTSQREAADVRQVQNSAGGFTFTLDDQARLRRFLTLGTDGATYYTSAHELTKDNALVLLRLAESDHRATVDTVVSVSEVGRAPKQNPALFALALLSSTGSDAERGYALSMLPRVARTGTHLFIFARYVEQFRGWGRGLRRAVGDWYLNGGVNLTAYQAVKYRQREGWSHRDLLRLSHPRTSDPARIALFDWIARSSVGEDTPRIVEGYVKASEDGADVPALVRAYGLSWEMLPDEALNDPKVWDALLDGGLPQTALMRQLPRLTRLGILGNMSARTAEVAARLSDSERLRKARVHPVNVLVAARTYASGQSARGESTWQPARQIADALDAAFYAAFGAVEPAGKRTMLALDVSGSMTSAISNMPLSCREASAALALVTMATEPLTEVVGFTSAGGNYWSRDAALTPLPISPRQRLDDAIRAVSNLPFGGTDCALPWTWALERGIEVDTIVTFTDNETWAGPIHTHQAVRRYREATGIPARSIVVGMTSSGFTVNDPSDPLGLDVVGFDSAIPNLIADFSRGF